MAVDDIARGLAQERIAALTAENARLRARLAELEAAQAQPAAADPDLRLLLEGVERLRARLYPPVTAVFPTTIHGVQLSKAQQRLVEDQVYAWRNPTDGSKPLSFPRIAERLGCTPERAHRLANQATWRHERAR